MIRARQRKHRRSIEEIEERIKELREKETHTLITDDDYGLYDKLADELEWVIVHPPKECINCKWLSQTDLKTCMWHYRFTEQNSQCMYFSELD